MGHCLGIAERRYCSAIVPRRVVGKPVRRSARQAAHAPCWHARNGRVWIRGQLTGEILTEARRRSPGSEADALRYYCANGNGDGESV